MTRRNASAIAIIAASVTAVVGVALAAQDRFTLKAPNGVAFSEFKGYETWEAIAPSQTDEGIKIISGNPVMMSALKSGIPGSGGPVPDGAMMTKVEWTKKKSTTAPYAVMIPDTLRTVSFMVKDSRRFPDTNGWGYAQFAYDAPSESFKPYGSDSSFGKTVCHQCHTRVKATDYVFTNYARR